MTETVMTAQEVFDIAVGGVIKQGALSVSAGESGQCLYRGPNGLKCAAGHLLQDSEIEEEVTVRGMRLPERLRPHLDLIADLQEAHDSGWCLEDKEAMSGFVEDCAGIAASRGLKMVEVPA